jgi:hypothetical protein
MHDNRWILDLEMLWDVLTFMDHRPRCLFLSSSKQKRILDPSLRFWATIKKTLANSFCWSIRMCEYARSTISCSAWYAKLMKCDTFQLERDLICVLLRIFCKTRGCRWVVIIFVSHRRRSFIHSIAPENGRRCEICEGGGSSYVPQYFSNHIPLASNRDLLRRFRKEQHIVVAGSQHL